MADRDDSRAAYVEDCAPDGNEGLAGTRQTAHSRTRRQSYSQPLIARAGVRNDEVSDSGYSSHTGATVASVDSAMPAEQRPLFSRRLPKLTSKTTGESTKKKRPGLFPSKTVSNSHGSGEQPFTGVSSARSPNKSKSAAHGRGRCPCEECTLRRKVEVSPLERPWGLEFPPETEPRYTDPASPTMSRRLSQRSAALPQDYRPRPRLSTSTSRAARPSSMYSSGSLYGEMGYSGASLDAAYDRGHALHGSSYMDIPSRASYMPTQSSYPGPSSYPEYADPLSYTTSRSVPRRLSDYAAARPSSYCEPSYGDYDDLAPPSWARDRRSTFHPADFDRYEPRQDEDYRRMPPPPPPMRRASTRQPYTSSAAHDARRRESVHTSDTGATVSDDRYGRSSTPYASSAARRPTLSSANAGKKSMSYNDGARATQAESRSHRRASYIGPEKVRDQARSAEAYQQATGTMPTDGYYTRRQAQFSSSSSGSRSRASSSRESGDVRARAGSRASNNGVKVQIDRGGGVQMNLSGIEGHAVSFNSGKDGDQFEVIIDRHRYQDAGRPRVSTSTTQSRPSSKVPIEREAEWI